MFKFDSFIYDSRISLGWLFWLPLVIVPILSLISFLLWREQGATERDLLGIIEIWLPILIGAMTAPLMSREAEVNFQELRKSYPENRLRIPVQRTLLSFIFLLLLWILAMISFLFSFGSYDIIIFIIPIAPCFFVMGLSLLIGNLSQNYVLATAIVLLYCLFESQTGGSITGLFYLFNGFLPNGTPLLLNRCLLFIASFVLFFLNAGVSLGIHRIKLNR